MGIIDVDACSKNTLEEDEYCILMTVYDILTDVRDQIIRIHGRSPETVTRLISEIREEVMTNFGMLR